MTQGKIRHAGMSNYDVPQMPALRRFGPVQTLQPPYHLFRRDIEHTILPYTRQHDIGVLVYGPMAHGLLSGQISESTGFAADDWRSRSPDFTGEAYRRNLAVVARLTDLAREWGITLPQLAVAWRLANPAVHVAVVGACRASHLDGTVPAVDIDRSEANLKHIDAALADAVPVRGRTRKACEGGTRPWQSSRSSGSG